LTAFYALAIAHAMNLPKEERRRVCLAAKFHDIGKVGMPTSTFEGRLDDNNIDLIRKHPHEGAYHLTHRMSVDPKLHLDRQTLIYVMDHHERYDGKGYPVGLAGEEIPLGARIIAVADAYATMTAGRPYRKRITHKAAVEEIVRNSGTQFDPTVVEAFTRTFGMAK
jgi:HD-GYP domain-containing protein (c-di-GMP phosphodiesterase class II)